jgi:hypothetical protein
MTNEEASLELQSCKTSASTEAMEKALDALAFLDALHNVFKDNGMTTTESSDVNELENLIDALSGELGAAVLFLCENSFARVPDMLRVIGAKLEKQEDVPPEVAKGFTRLAKRIENAKVNMQSLVQTATDASDKG